MDPHIWPSKRRTASEDTGCIPENLPEAMNHRGKWRERVRISEVAGNMMMMMMISIVCVHTQLHVKTVLFQTIQFSISTQFNSIWPIDRTELPWKWWLWRGGLHLQKLQFYMKLAIRLLRVKTRTFDGVRFTPLQRCPRCILQSKLFREDMDSCHLQGHSPRDKHSHASLSIRLCSSLGLCLYLSLPKYIYIYIYI